MKPLNDNRANLLLMFTRCPLAKIFTKELEYYQSDDEKLIGLISLDRTDHDYITIFLDRNSRGCYETVKAVHSIETIEEARINLREMMDSYVRNERIMKKDGEPIDFFKLVADKKQIHPNFQKLNDEGFFVGAKKVIEEVGYHHVDIDGNFIDQFQSRHGFDARIWELYLWCYFREEDFEFDTSHDAPDFMLRKFGEEVAVEAVHTKRTQGIGEELSEMDLETMQDKLRNEIPLMFGSTLFSKLRLNEKKTKYWELAHVKGKPLIFAIADFHADMSMTWSFPAIISMLYGIEQKVKTGEDGQVTLVSASGNKFEKSNDIEIMPLFLDERYKHVSAVLFSPCGTISKFNRMGVQAGYGDSRYTLIHLKLCFNHLENAIYPNVFFNVVDENCHETWADGIQIFHNPMAEIPLDPQLFPHVGHHYYKDGLLYSNMPQDSIMSSMTWNIKNMPFKMDDFGVYTKNIFDLVMKQYNM